MNNKDYKRLTRKWETSLPTELTPCVHTHDRLWKLENAIENGTLVFLPCKVGDEFWWILKKHSGEYEILKEKVKQIRICDYGFIIIDFDGARWELDEIYFTKEEAEKALEELEK